MRYPLFDLGQQGRSPNVNSERRVNLYAEVKQHVDKTALVFYGTPGKVLFLDLGLDPIRGFWQMGSYFYAVQLGSLYKIASDGTYTNVGTLSTSTGRVCMSDNGTQLMIVDGTWGYIYTPGAGTFAKITDADFAGFSSPTTVTFESGFFVVTFANSGRFLISALYDGVNWTATDYANAESSPDPLVHCLANAGQLVLLGDLTTEHWTNTGATDFPYQRIQGATSEWGLHARWSVVKFGEGLVGLVKSKAGEVLVAKLDGYAWQSISTPELVTAINSYSVTSDATGLSYLKGGHGFYQINFGTANKSWLYDGLSGAWSELQSGTNGDRDRAEIATHYLAKSYVSDYGSGKVYTLDLEAVTENGQPIIRELTSRHVSSEKQLKVYRLWLDIEAGVGNATAPGDVPVVMLQVSKDGGRSFGTEIMMQMGHIGERRFRCYTNRLGRGYDWVFKFRISDPVKVVILGGWLTTESNANDNFLQPMARAVA